MVPSEVVSIEERTEDILDIPQPLLYRGMTLVHGMLSEGSK